MSIQSEFNGVRALVERALETYPETRASDTLLFLRCNELLGLYTTEQMMETPINSSTIERLRRTIQNAEGNFLPSEEVLQARRIRESNIRKYFRDCKLDK